MGTIALLVAVLAAAAPAKGQPRPKAKPAPPPKVRIAVVPLEASPELLFTGKSVALAFAAKAQEAGFEVVGPEQVEEKLGRAATRTLASCGDDARCLADKSAKLEVDGVVGGWLEKRDAEYRVSLVHADVKTGKRLGALERVIPIASRRLQKDIAAAAPGLLAGQADATGTLKIETDKPGALVTVDDVPVGTTPLARTVKPGKHKVHVSRTGYVDTEPTWVDVPANGVVEHRPRLYEIPARDRPNESLSDGTGTKVQIVR
jgi:hypothetical protein